MSIAEPEIEAALAAVKAARSQKLLSERAVENISTWLREPHFSDFKPELISHITSGKWRELEDAFWTTIPFGTAGRRGRMYAIGTNAINDRTMGESAQGLAEYIVAYHAAAIDKKFRCAIAYDTRHRSRQFAELCAEVMVANGFEVVMLDGHRATPELSFTVRTLQCDCGIMISASHNPPSDNAIKAFWSTGGQLRPPHDLGAIEYIERVTTIKRASFSKAIADGKIQFVQKEMDVGYQAAVHEQSESGPRDLRILYSPLHGVGRTSVLPVLQADGFDAIEVYERHATPDGDFPNVPGNVANPENVAVFDALIEHAKQTDADLVLASDPDADRIGCAAPVRIRVPGEDRQTIEWRTLSGNQIGALIGELLLRRLQAADKLTPHHYVIKTLVTSDMICRIAEQLGARSFGDVLTGFKWIGSLIDEIGPKDFVFGFEEAHGYLAGTYARDKDGAMAAMLLAELAAECKQQHRTLHEQLDQLFLKYGCHLEKSASITMPGADGMARMKGIMEQLRTAPPNVIGGLAVRQVRDYQTREIILPPDLAAKCASLDPGALTDLLIFDLDPLGYRAAVRPSGTEPKIKFYLFAAESPDDGSGASVHTSLLMRLEETKSRLAEHLAEMERDLLAFAK
jgi:phosphoglucomutase